jgi:hypothetical protein
MKLLISFLFVSINAFAADIVKPLPSADPLAKTVNAIATQLSDGNISNHGANLLWVGHVVKSDQFENLLRKGFSDAYKFQMDQALPANAKLEITKGTFVDGDGKPGSVYKMTAALLEANDYNTSNKEIWESQARYLWAVLRKFPVSSKTQFGHIKTSARNSSGKKQSIQYFLLLNPDQKAIQFFTAQGSM